MSVAYVVHYGGAMAIESRGHRKRERTYSSHLRANQYRMKTWAVRTTPATLPVQRETPRKFRVLPQYIGEPVTLNGKPVTGASMRMPK